MDQESQSLQTTPIHVWIGIVAADKGVNDIFIEVMVAELVPVLTGTLGASTKSQSVKLKNLDGGNITSNVTTKTTITAYYYGNSTNRSYPPDVVKGEQVRILQFANSDKYYWESMGRDDGLRKTETYRVEAKNRKNFSDPTDDAHSYSFELDSKRSQHIRLLTSKGNGEAYAYVLLLDAKNGKVQLSDDTGNAITIDSANSKVIVQNSKNAFLMLNGLDIVLGSPRDITLKATRQLVMDSPLTTISCTSGSGILAINGKSVSINASSSVITKSPSIGLSGAVQVPGSLIAGQLTASGISQGSPGASYQPASINVGNGTGRTPIVTPNISTGGVSVQWSSGGGGSGSGTTGTTTGTGINIVTLATTISSTNQTIPIPTTPTWASVYINGLRQDNSVYSIATGILTIEPTAIEIGDVVEIDYQP